jgi:hypothetical protein
MERLGHRWRLRTWAKKYAARLQSYSLDDCMTAIEGFCAMPWYVQNQSQNAPDLIFRSDRQIEKFLAFGMKLRREADAATAERDTAKYNAARMTALREHLHRSNGNCNKRLKEKLAPLKDRINEHSWTAFIEPLLYADFKKGTVILFHEEASWVQEHYAAMIGEALGHPVIITNEM